MGRWTIAAAVALALLIASCAGSDPVALDESVPTSTSSSILDQTSADLDIPVETTTTAPDPSLPIVFADPAQGLDDATLEAFISGQGFFNEIWTPVGPGETGSDGLGPLFNADSCAVCHPSTGRRQVPPDGELTNAGLIVRLSIPGADPSTGAPLPEPSYGDQLQDRAVGANDAEGTIFTNYVVQQGTYPDGTPFELLWPTVNIRSRSYGPLTEGFQVSARIGAQLVGMGLLELVPEDDILRAADPTDADGDGVSGRPNAVWNPVTDRIELGRFGWKANVVQLDQQIAQAFHGDIGITSSLVQQENCTTGQTVCDDVSSGGSTEVSDDKLTAITTYLRLLAVPETRTSGDPLAERGEVLFGEFGCAACHTEELTTSPSPIAALSEQTIRPYTDLLLHDMGFDMGDDRPDFAASGVEWRTPPLWGLGLVPVEGDRGLLHDGRARTLEEAIIWHGGEGARSRANFLRAELDDRQALLAFLDSL
ncbi:MAG: CxxC motif-containing protein (DUF1111 family) [Verrucomicrobiales bacterium]|jgi:CxxC motif-containing protein (DUF1111 family)